MNLLKQFLRTFILFLLCGFIYYMCEMIFRGYSHWTMYILGGFVGVICDALNNIYGYDMDYLLQVGIGTVTCTILEGIVGLIINPIWHVWDYSNLWGTFFYGQCNILFVGVWFLLIGLVAIPFGDAYNYYFCKIDPCPYYQTFGKVFFKFTPRKDTK